MFKKQANGHLRQRRVSLYACDGLGETYYDALEANPFARKAAQDTSKNVFARRTQTINLTKSDSFFDKVDAVEADASKKREFS